MNNQARWTIMTVLLIISFLVFDREEMMWTYMVWGAMVLVIAIDYRLWLKKREKMLKKPTKLKQNK